MVYTCVLLLLIILEEVLTKREGGEREREKSKEENMVRCSAFEESFEIDKMLWFQ